MPRTENQKTANLLLTISIVICIALQNFFPFLKHDPSITIVQNLHTGVVKAGGETYFSNEILRTATIKIRDAGVFTKGFLTNNYLNGIVTLALQATLITVLILLLLKKPIRQTVIFSIIGIILLYGIGYIYTYQWFQANGIALSRSGYELVLPFSKNVFLLIFIGSLLYRWDKNTRPQKIPLI